MRKVMCLVLMLVGVIVLHTPAQEADAKKAKIPYLLKFDRNKGITQLKQPGKDLYFVKVRFTIELVDGAAVDKIDGDYKIRIEEDGKTVKEVDIPAPDLTQGSSVMFAIDTSSSMKGDRLPQVRNAATVFLQQLQVSAECGLILFDQEIRETVKRTRDRAPLLAKIKAIETRGENAYFDAAFKGIEMLRDTPKGRDRVLVLMTDGIDKRSKNTVEQLVTEAKKEKVQIYTIGIGELGKNEKVNTVLVLDHSGSMSAPADNKDKKPKIKALHEAGLMFVDEMTIFGRASIVPFSTTAEKPTEFRGKSKGHELKGIIRSLDAYGETALFDATYTAISVLEADGTEGKRVVIAMTDGVDNSSRRRKEEVIAHAQQANIPLYMLGFGRKDEIDVATMEEMAEKTKGKFDLANNEASLVKMFKDLSIQLHDNSINEELLKKIASNTGGNYYHVKNVADLKLILAQVGTNTHSIPPFEIDYESPRQSADGSLREVSLSLVHRGEVLEKKVDSYHRRGLVVGEMNHVVYLVLLVLMGGLIALPALFRRRATA
jgi:VWFA-related protein